MSSHVHLGQKSPYMPFPHFILFFLSWESEAEGGHPGSPGLSFGSMVYIHGMHDGDPTLGPNQLFISFDVFGVCLTGWFCDCIFQAYRQAGYDAPTMAPYCSLKR